MIAERRTVNRSRKAVTTMAAAVALVCVAGTATSAATVAPNALPSACEGTQQLNQATNAKHVKFLEAHTWVECFLDVTEINSELWIQKWWKEGPGPGYWIRVGEISTKHFPGVSEKKFYNNYTIACSGVGGHGAYRAAAEATWENSEGEVGHTDIGYSIEGIYC
jgi:hypothetical protein